LDENARSLTTAQQSTACSLLNNASNDNYLATEWELVILNAASKLGSVEHEAELGGSRPDLRFTSDDGQVEFIADITAASDEGFHDLNPTDTFHEEFQRRVLKFGWTSGGFHIQTDPHTTRLYRGMDDRVRLKLPARSTWGKTIFNSDFNRFLRRVQSEPQQKQTFDIVSADTGVHITYDPAKRGTSGAGHLVYTIATAIDRNPVYTALKSKGDQIKRAHYQGLAGIFLCDAGCQMLTADPHFSSFSTDDVIRSFFRQYDSVWFVVVFGVKERDSRPYVVAKIHLNPKKGSHDFSRLTQIVGQIHRALPEPQFSSYNARYRIKARDLAGRYYGHLKYGGTIVEMSAREFLEILAGTKTVAEFEQNYGCQPGANPFKQQLSEGRLISKITIERIPEKDDDKVMIEFGPPDAAVAKFRVP
jgi:hypothetical protein